MQVARCLLRDFVTHVKSLCIVMASSTSALDSTAAFRERLSQLGLDAIWGDFEARGWSTMGSFAFATGFTSNAADDERWVQAVLVPLLGAEAAVHPKAAAIRRLYFECYTVAAADLKRRVTRTDDDQPVRMPTAERQSRRDSTAARLSNLDIEEDMEPSNALIDLCATMADTNSVVYVAWDKCTTFDQELDRPSGEAWKKEWKADSQGYMRESASQPELVADVGANTRARELKLQSALVRRSLAMDMAGVMSYEAAMRITKYLMKKFLASPPDDRYASPSLEQIRRADVFIWKELARACRRGVRPIGGGQLPLDAAVGEVLRDPELALIVQCLPRVPGREGDNKAADRRPETQAKSRNQRRKDTMLAKKRELEESESKLRAENEALRKAARAAGGKGQGTGKGGPIRLPPGLLGKEPKTKDGRNICFGYNLHTCETRGVPPGGRCPKGYHVCMEPVDGAACGLNHPVDQHR